MRHGDTPCRLQNYKGRPDNGRWPLGKLKTSLAWRVKAYFSTTAKVDAVPFDRANGKMPVQMPRKWAQKGSFTAYRYSTQKSLFAYWFAFMESLGTAMLHR